MRCVVSVPAVVALVAVNAACVHPTPLPHGGDAHAARRLAAIRRAQVWAPTDIPAMDLRLGPQGPGTFLPNQVVECEYVDKPQKGRSPKFLCSLGSHDELKVKYGRSNGEVYGEVAATRLLWALGFGADRMYPVRVICRGCPDNVGTAATGGVRVVDPAAIERKLDAWKAEGQDRGWSWAELDLIDEARGGAPLAQRDALKLLAAFMQHSDTKPEQQRMVCLDRQCERPFLLLDDVGLTFGRANLVN